MDHQGSIRVMICDDHALFRRGLIMVLEAEPDIEVVAEAEDGREAHAIAAQVAPDVILLDTHMPVVDGLEAAAAMHGTMPAVAVVMLTVNETDESDALVEALSAGAAGAIVKEDAITLAGQAIRACMAGELVLTPHLAARIGERLTQLTGRSAEISVSSAELEVLQSLAEGQDPTAIGEESGLERKTVINHARNALAKLHQAHRTGLLSGVTSTEPVARG